MTKSGFAGGPQREGRCATVKTVPTIVEEVVVSRGYQGVAVLGNPQPPKGGTAVMHPRNGSSTIGRNGDRKR